MPSVKCIHTLAGMAGLNAEDYHALLRERFHVESSKDLDEPGARQLCALLRGMGAGDAKKRVKRTAAERKIWGLWYQLQPYLAPCERCDAYLVGMIGKVTGGEDIPGLIDGKKIDFNRLGKKYTWKFIEALKKRIRWGQNRSGEEAVMM